MSQPVVTQPVDRSVTAIDADLHSCRAVRRAAERELAQLRRRQEELADLEAALLVTIDIRRRSVDLLLDERLRAVSRNGRQEAVATPRRRSPPSTEEELGRR